MSEPPVNETRSPNPETDIYIRMWRPPWGECRNADCPICGVLVEWPADRFENHYLRGHFDVPQYDTRVKDGA